jgi:hypothetical protein
MHRAALANVLQQLGNFIQQHIAPAEQLIQGRWA